MIGDRDPAVGHAAVERHADGRDPDPLVAAAGDRSVQDLQLRPDRKHRLVLDRGGIDLGL